jgi:hypothetical protein
MAFLLRSMLMVCIWLASQATAYGQWTASDTTSSISKSIRWTLFEQIPLSKVSPLDLPYEEPLTRIMGKRQAFFCRMESRIEQHCKLAPRLRLGSLEYVDWLEQKPGR